MIANAHHARARMSLWTQGLSQVLVYKAGVYKRIPTPARSFSTALPRQSLASSSSSLITKPNSSRSAFKRNMSSNKDTTDHSDINKMKAQKDGSFKRLDSSFRDFIVAGSKFEPEAGTHPRILSSSYVLMLWTRPIPSLCLLCLPWVKSSIGVFIPAKSTLKRGLRELSLCAS